MADPPRWALQPRSVVVRASSVACSTVVVDDVGSLLLTSTSLSSTGDDDGVLCFSGGIVGE